MAGISFIEVLESLDQHQEWGPEQNEARLDFGQFQNMLLTEDYTSCLRKQRELWHMISSQELGKEITQNKRGALPIMIVNVKLLRAYVRGAKTKRK